MSPTPIHRLRTLPAAAAALLTALALCVASPARAANDMPWSTFEESVLSSIDRAYGPIGNSGVDSRLPEIVQYSATTPFGSLMSGYASTGGGSRPWAEVSVTGNGVGGYSTAAGAHIIYYVRLDGLPAGTPVPMQMHYSAWSTLSPDGREGGGGGATIRLESGPQRYRDEILTWGPGNIFVAAMDNAFHFDMRAGALYLVDLYVSANVYKGTATTFLDPVFQFAPGVDTRGLSLSFSSGVTAVSAVPEPASWMLLAAGVAALGLRRRAKPWSSPERR